MHAPPFSAACLNSVEEDVMKTPQVQSAHYTESCTRLPQATFPIPNSQNGKNYGALSDLYPVQCLGTNVSVVSRK
jgi:hypothetical protein